MVPAAAALRRHYGGISRPCVVVTRDADHVGDPKDQSIRLGTPMTTSVVAPTRRGPDHTTRAGSHKTAKTARRRTGSSGSLVRWMEDL
jgi:hypothetical protein